MEELTRWWIMGSDLELDKPLRSYSRSLKRCKNATFHGEVSGLFAAAAAAPVDAAAAKAADTDAAAGNIAGTANATVVAAAADDAAAAAADDVGVLAASFS